MEQSGAVANNFFSIVPYQDILVGGLFFIFIVFFHTSGVRYISTYFQKKVDKLTVKPKLFSADILFSSTLSLLFLLHFLEIILWTTLIVTTGLVSNWRSAGFFTANSYTALGYGVDILPDDWKILAPIIAMSGLFTFGWTGSVLVGLVMSYNKLRESHRRKPTSAPNK